MRRLGGVLALAAASALACRSQASAPSTPPPAAPVSKVVFLTASGDVPVQVEVADTPAERSRGLMFRRELAPDRGMIFVFDEVSDHEFWMKNTYIPLDMIFVSSDRRVVGVVNAAPLDETAVGVGKPSKYVIEVNAGFARKYGIDGGTLVRLELASTNKQGS